MRASPDPIFIKPWLRSSAPSSTTMPMSVYVLNNADARSSPSGQTWASVVTSSGLMFIVWHTWHFDRWRCFLFTREDWFKPAIVWMIFSSVTLFTVWAWMEAYVLYDEYYVFLAGETMIKPWQLWSKHNQHLSRCARFLLVPAWTLLLGAHCEEFAYWGYLMTSIRSTGSAKAWLESRWFYGWLGCVVSSFALLLASSLIEYDNIDRLQAYIFLVGSCLSVILALASIALCFLFPPFIHRLSDQGADEEVIDRLRFVSSLNSMRTIIRVVYSVAFLIISVDSMTDKHVINSSELWTDLCFVSGELGIFVSASMSVAILLPRNMYQESLPTQAGNFAPMTPYNPKGPGKPTQLQLANSASPQQWYDMGDRLNVARSVMASGVPAQAYEMPFSNITDRKDKRLTNLASPLPRAIQHYTSPLDALPERSYEQHNVRVVVTSESEEEFK